MGHNPAMVSIRTLCLVEKLMRTCTGFQRFWTSDSDWGSDLADLTRVHRCSFRPHTCASVWSVMTQSSVSDLWWSRKLHLSISICLSHHHWFTSKSFPADIKASWTDWGGATWHAFQCVLWQVVIVLPDTTHLSKRPLAYSGDRR